MCIHAWLGEIMFRVVLFVAAVIIGIADAPIRKLHAQESADTAQTDNVRAGDRWIYEVKDEITGEVRGVRTYLVTEVLPKEIVVRVSNARSNGLLSMVYDRSWNVVSSGDRKYSPNDGTGVQLPLAVGKTWKVELNDVNSANGSIFKRTVTSKVVGRESITTPVGTVDAFVIEKTYVTRNPKNPAVKLTAEGRMWYDSEGNYLVKRTFAARRDGRLVEHYTYSLTQFIRKP
jgi:hypothetical protein